ncbi:MAG: replicative DNA helicase [Treponema sp.]|nr:replicative DNA helicase [Treponema sp.]
MALDFNDKIPPHNEEAEQAVLGALLLDWKSIPTAIEYLRPERFFSQKNQVVFEAMLSLYRQGITGDLISLVNELTTTGRLDAAGGVAYVSALTNTVPTSANIEHYAEIVRDNSIRRDLISMSADMKLEAYDATKKSSRILDSVEQKIFQLNDKNQMNAVYVMKDVIPKTIDEIDNRYKNSGSYTGIPSGFIDLDGMTSGFQKSELIIIGARPSMGKTAMALSMMQHIAIERDIPTGFFSLEMSVNQIGQRILSQVARVSGTRLRSGVLKMDDFKRIQDAAGKCYSSPLYIVDTPNMKLLDLRAMARRLRVNYNVQIIFIDYIGLITSENADAPVYEQISEISKSLKALARELEIPIVVLCQVARSAEAKEPNLAELRGSGSIEQDADVVMFIHRERKKTDEENPVMDAKLIVAKQRNGPIGDVDLLFIPSYTKFENKEKKSFKTQPEQPPETDGQA